MKIRSGTFLLTLVFSLFLQGCAGIYSVVEFEVLEPATISFPGHVQKLLFINRAPVTPDIWAKQNRGDLNRKQLVMLDTLICNNLNRGVFDVLRQSPRESFRKPVWLNKRRRDTAYLEDLILTRREVAALCSEWFADAVISLEYFYVGLDQHYDYYEDAPGVVMNHYYEVFNRIKWNIHLPDRPVPFDSYTTVDTLFFPDLLDGEILQEYYATDMLRDLFYESGFKYGRYLVPVWNETQRNIFKGKGDSLKIAARFTQQGAWDEAYHIWEQLAGSADSSMVSKAYYNMAIFYELEDNLDSASLLLDLALGYDTLDLLSSYREELDVRLMNRKEIIKQVE